MRRAVALEASEPLAAERPAPRTQAAPEVLPHAVGHEELRILRPPIGTLGQPDLLLAQRLAMGRARILLARRAVGDVAVDDDQGGPVGGPLESPESPLEHLEIVGVPDPRDVPAIAEEARGDVLAERPLGMSLDGDPVVVVDPAEV